MIERSDSMCLPWWVSFPLGSHATVVYHFELRKTSEITSKDEKVFSLRALPLHLYIVKEDWELARMFAIFFLSANEQMATSCNCSKLNYFSSRILKTTILDKINGTSGPPLPPIQWCQNGAFLLLRAFIIALAWGGRGLIVPFYSVQDCRLDHQPLFGKGARAPRHERPAEIEPILTFSCLQIVSWTNRWLIDNNQNLRAWLSNMALRHWASWTACGMRIHSVRTDTGRTKQSFSNK